MQHHTQAPAGILHYFLSRLHVLLASNPAIAACTGALAVDKGEEFRIAAALHGAFHAVDKEILQKSKEEDGRDGSTGLVLLRIGMHVE